MASRSPISRWQKMRGFVRRRIIRDCVSRYVDE
jgi:hypothetical protein